MKKQKIHQLLCLILIQASFLQVQKIQAMQIGPNGIQIFGPAAPPQMLLNNHGVSRHDGLTYGGLLKAQNQLIGQ